MPTQKEIVDAVAAQLGKKDLSGQAVMVLKRATDKVLERIKQNVDAQVKEDSMPIVEVFVKNVADKLSAMTQTWHSGETNELTVLPEGTRFVHRDGGVQTIVVEQQPQARHILFGNGRHPKLLAMPYVQFILGFNRHKPITVVNVGMTKKPITDLDRPLNHPILPNITNHSVCMGEYRWPTSGTMTEMVDNIIGAFWQSIFTGDAQGAMTKWLQDNGIANIDEWERRSKADPLFVVQPGIKYQPALTVRGLLHTDQGGKGSQVALITGLKQEITTAVGQIGGEINALLTGVDIKTENRDKVHVDTLQAVLKEIIVQAYSELWEYLQKQLQEERGKLQSEMRAAADKLKSDFMYYMDKKKQPW